MTFRPFQDAQLSLGNLQDEMNHLLARVWHTGVSTGPLDGQEWAPVIDMEEFADRYELYVEVPGVDGSSVELSYVANELTICGEKSRPTGANDSDRSVRRERRFGTFCRRIAMPSDIESEKLSASCRNGVLVVSIPKSESNRPKPIKISVGDD